MTAQGQAGRRGDGITSPEYDTEFRDCIVCPWCGHEDHDAWELFDSPLKEVTESDCIRCERPIRVTQDIDITYSTAKVAGVEEGEE